MQTQFYTFLLVVFSITSFTPSIYASGKAIPLTPKAEEVKKEEDKSKEAQTKTELAKNEKESKDDALIAQELFPLAAGQPQEPVKTILINFNNVTVIEFIRFLSKISNKNFIFDEEDLQFQITIVSEEPTTIENIMSALLQELRVHDLNLTEQGNNIIIHRNPAVNGISKVVAENLKDESETKSEIVTRLFRLNIADPEKIASLIRPLMSQRAIAEVFKDTNHLIVTDLVTNIEQIAQLVKSLDAPNNGLVIGQYVVKRGFMDSLIKLAQQIMSPISLNQTLIFVPHRAANSIFVVSTPFLMDRTVALLQYLDQTQGITRIFDLNDLKFTPEAEGEGLSTQQGQWQLQQGSWVFRPNQEAGIPRGNQPPQGYWFIDDDGNWRFQMGPRPSNLPVGTTGLSGPEGQWKLDPEGIWLFQLAAGKSISPERLVRPTPGTADLPLGHIERTQFYIYKMQYRNALDVQIALGRIGLVLSESVANNMDLVETIYSIQAIEPSNSLVFTGTAESIEKVRELIAEIDTPLRQVYLEVLILETTLEDSLHFGVEFGTRFGGCETAGSQAFLEPASVLPLGLDTGTGINVLPDARILARNEGFSLGVIGRHITHCGLSFDTIGALVKAVHTIADSEIIISPKLLTEDNYTAEIFVGINTQFPTQAIVNDRGEIITQNFEFRDVGTLLRITPLIGDNDIITLTIEEENSSIDLAATLLNPSQFSGPTTRRSRTLTRVHLPNEYFLVMSGMMQEEDRNDRRQIPCLGGIPFIGAAFRQDTHRDSRRNVMLFLRPRIIDTVEEIQNLTKHQQDLYKYKNRHKTAWKYEVEEALNFFNLPQCGECCDDECECATFPN